MVNTCISYWRGFAQIAWLNVPSSVVQLWRAKWSQNNYRDHHHLINNRIIWNPASPLASELTYGNLELHNNTKSRARHHKPSKIDQRNDFNEFQQNFKCFTENKEKNWKKLKWGDIKNDGNTLCHRSLMRLKTHGWSHPCLTPDRYLRSNFRCFLL